MNQAKNSSLFSGRQSTSESVVLQAAARLNLTQKEIEMLRLAKRAGTSLEAMAKLILLLRSRKKAADSQAANAKNLVAIG